MIIIFINYRGKNEKDKFDNSSKLENVSTHKSISKNMKMKPDWDADRLHFNTGAKGTVKISMTSNTPVNLRIGSTCGNQEYDHISNQTSYENSIAVEANAPIHIIV